jgi:hypothetical protein
MSIIKYKHYVYAHVRNDTGDVFYIGKGTDSKKYKKFHRAYETKRRNSIWNHIVAKAGYSVKVIAVCENDEWAKVIEIALIKYYGRIDSKTGILANLTDGGDGSCGIIVSDELRRERSINSSGERSEAWISAIRAARKNGGNGGVVKLGDKLSDAWKKNIAKTKIGNLNPMYGRISPKAIKVINIETGEVYDSVTLAAKATGQRMQTLHNRLTGFRKNNTPMRFKDAA